MSIVSLKTYISLLIYCFANLFIGVSGTLKSSTIIVLLLIFPFILVSISHAPMLSAYIFIIVISSLIDPLIIIQCPSLSLITVFISKSILFDMSIATPAFFWSPCMKYLFPALHFQSVCVPGFEVGLL